MNMDYFTDIVILCFLLGLSAGQDAGTTTMGPTPMSKMAAPNLLPLIVPVVTMIICSVVIIVVIILYLRCCHRTAGDKVSDVEKSKKTEKTKSTVGGDMPLLSLGGYEKDAESVLNGAKDQLREIKSLEKNLGISVKEFKNLMWHATSILKLIDEGIDEESEPKNLKDELFSEVNKRVAKDPKDRPDDDDDDEPKKRRIESAREKQNRLFTETNKVLNDGKKFIKEANQKDIEIRNFTKDAKKALTQVKDRVRAMKKPTDKKKDGKFGKGEESKPLLK